MGFIFSSFTVYYHINQVLLFSERQDTGFSLSSFTVIIIRSYYFQTGRVWDFPFLFSLIQCVIVMQYLTFFRELGFLGLGFSRSFPLFSGAEESSMLCPEPGFYNP